MHSHKLSQAYTTSWLKFQDIPQKRKEFRQCFVLLSVIVIVTEFIDHKMKELQFC